MKRSRARIGAGPARCQRRDAPRGADRALIDARLEYEDEGSGQRQVVTLVRPSAVDGTAGRISVLDPLGLALLGLREGQSVDWPLQHGHRRRIRLIRVLPRRRSPAGDG